MQVYEGYTEKGMVYPHMPLAGIQGRRRVIITVLDETVKEKPSTWYKLDKIVSEMDELPRIEDFPRCKIGRTPIDFETV